MYVGSDFADIDPGEDEDFTIDFARDLFGAETIASVTFVLEVVFGTDGSPSARLIGSGSIIGTKVTQEIANCQEEVYYRLTAEVTTNNGRIKHLWSHFWCRTPH